MNMKIEDYEKQAEELTKQAAKLEATMLTFKALQECMKTGFNFDFWIDEESKAIQGMCNKSGIYIRAENYTMWFDENNEEGFGELAGKKLEDIDVEIPEPSPETTETDEKPSVPVENNKRTDGIYRVDVSNILGRGKDD
tara:strand:+ start:1373 stop:1789 length:417 start_codon:yes stop_codon:yes gene_type:complete